MTLAISIKLLVGVLLLNGAAAATTATISCKRCKGEKVITTNDSIATKSELEGNLPTWVHVKAKELTESFCDKSSCYDHIEATQMGSAGPSVKNALKEWRERMIYIRNRQARTKAAPKASKVTPAAAEECNGGCGEKRIIHFRFRYTRRNRMGSISLMTQSDSIQWCEQCAQKKVKELWVKEDTIPGLRETLIAAVTCNGGCNKVKKIHFRFTHNGMEMRWCEKCTKKCAKKTWLSQIPELAAELKKKGLLTRRRLLGRLQQSRARRRRLLERLQGF